jgi:Transposase DDE domain
MTQEEFIIYVYCIIADQIGPLRIRQAGFPPRLSDAEALTLVIVGEFLGMHEDKAIWRYFKTHYSEWFPGLGSRSAFVRQCANLLGVKQWLLSRFFASSRCDTLHMQDGVPIPVVRYARARRDRCFKGVAAYGYCASKDEKYYGFHGHVTIDGNGQLSGFVLTPANASEREALLDVSPGLVGAMLGDKGYISAPLKEELAQQGLDLQTPLRKNMHDERSPACVKRIVSARRLVETVIGQLTERFQINAIRVKDFWHLQARIARKLLAHVLATRLAKSLGLRPTQLDALVIS